MRLWKDLAVKINDEILSAYIDGELTEENRIAVERASKKSSEVLKRIEEIRNIDDLFAKTYRAIDTTPVPENVLSTLQAFPQQRPNEGVEKVKTTPPTNDNRQTAKPKSFWYIGLAASILLVMVLGFGRTLPISATNEEQANEFIFAQQTAGVIGPENVLFNILENEHSGSSVIINQSSEAIVWPIMTFRNSENNYCRQFNITTSTVGTQNIACREGNNIWAVKVSVEDSNPSLSLDGLYQTATANSDPIIDAKVRQMIKGDAFGIETEAVLIEQKWPQN